ncbi:MAG: flagellar biosynthetic protein FliO [Spirochaetes bacterium]|nr:flagellar biosynthetic protein FliO [Spirochaetota bacterium]MBU0955342.1 flagellar biosynthetic protein FliO [Spirochaetota bacterium]
MNTLTRMVCLGLFLCLLGLPLVAQDQAPAVPPADNTDETTMLLQDNEAESAEGEVAIPSSSIFPYLLRMFLVLGLVLAAIYGLYILLRRKSAISQTEDPFVRVLGAVPLTPGRSVHVVAVGSRAWLVGAAESAVTLISELDDHELIEAMVKRAEENPKQYKGDFSSILAAMLPGKNTQPKAGGRAGTAFLGRQKDRLKKF